MNKLNLNNSSLLSKDELKNVTGGNQGARKSCPMSGSCSGSCSDSHGNAGTCKSGPAPTYDCQCNTGA